jgi:soluble P-type ATPase
MLETGVPGYKTLALSHLVLDYNGTMACDGRLATGVRERLEELSKSASIHILTADIVTRTILNALALLLHPLRLTATLRS